jgi:hypothetical protein
MDLRSLIDSAQSRSHCVSASLQIQDLFQKIEREAVAKDLRRSAWLTVLTATVMTINSPAMMTALFKYTTASESLCESILIVEFMREVGFLCISINGV